MIEIYGARLFTNPNHEPLITFDGIPCDVYWTYPGVSSKLTCLTPSVGSANIKDLVVYNEEFDVTDEEACPYCDPYSKPFKFMFRDDIPEIHRVSKKYMNKFGDYVRVFGRNLANLEFINPEQVENQQVKWKVEKRKNDNFNK